MVQLARMRSAGHTFKAIARDPQFRRSKVKAKQLRAQLLKWMHKNGPLYDMRDGFNNTKPAPVYALLRAMEDHGTLRSHRIWVLK